MLSSSSSPEPRDGPRDECGVFGVYAPGHSVSRLAFFALYALQHRGQESAGIAAADRGGNIMTRRDLGLVSQVFAEHDIASLGGELAIGHVRYSTTGSNAWANSQPVQRAAGAGGNRRELALGHNGNLINAVELHAELRAEGKKGAKKADGLQAVLDKIEAFKKGFVDAERSRVEKIRRQKRKRSRRAKQRMLDNKSHHGAKKESRRRVSSE